MKYSDCVKEIKRKLQPLELAYEGYDNLDKRKISDDSFHRVVLNFTQGFIDKIAVIQNIILQSQMIMVWSDTDKLVAQMNDLGLIVKNTVYDGSTFFLSGRKDEETFLIIAESELAILDLTTELEIRLLSYKDAIDSALLSNSSKIIVDMRKLLKQIESLWNIRKEAIDSYKFIN